MTAGAPPPLVLRRCRGAGPCRKGHSVDESMLARLVNADGPLSLVLVGEAGLVIITLGLRALGFMVYRTGKSFDRTLGLGGRVAEGGPDDTTRLGQKVPSCQLGTHTTGEGFQYTGPTTFRTKSEAYAWLAGVRVDLDRGAWIDPYAGSTADPRRPPAAAAEQGSMTSVPLVPRAVGQDHPAGLREPLSRASPARR